ncbi:MAG: winged helix-turn-helix domain-containing protein [Pyrinomonadaceae bacterium]
MVKGILRFGDCVLDCAKLRVSKGGKDVHLPPKVFEVLCYLAARPDDVIPYDELLDAVWPETHVEETNLRYSIHTIRKELGPDIVETVPKRGYRFAATIDLGDEPSGQSVADPIAAERRWTSRIVVYSGVVLLISGIIGAAYYFLATSSVRTQSDGQTLGLVVDLSLINEPKRRLEQIARFNTAIAFNLDRLQGMRVVPIDDLSGLSDLNPTAEMAARGLDGLVIVSSVESDLQKGINIAIYEHRGAVNPQTISFDSGGYDIPVEEAVAFRIGREIESGLDGKRDLLEISNKNISSEAKRIYLEGLGFLRGQDYGGREELSAKFARVVALEPDWDEPRGKLAISYFLIDSSEPREEEAKKAAEGTLRLNPRNVDALVTLGIKATKDWRFSEAREKFEKALVIDPSNAHLKLEFSRYLDQMRDFSKAEKLLKEAEQASPFSPMLRRRMCNHYYYDKKYDEARRQCNLFRATRPDSNIAKKDLYWIDIVTERYGSLLSEYKDLTDAEKKRHPLAAPLMAGDYKAYWLAKVEQRLKDRKRRPSPTALAGFYVMAGETEKALDELESGFELKTDELLVVNADPVFDPVRREPRFIALMKRVGVDSR